MAVPKIKDGKPVKPETAEHSKLNEVWSDKANDGAKYVIVHEEGGKGSPVGTLYTLAPTSRSFNPPAFTVTAWALDRYYRPRPEVDSSKVAAAITTDKIPG